MKLHIILLISAAIALFTSTLFCSVVDQTKTETDATYKAPNKVRFVSKSTIDQLLGIFLRDAVVGVVTFGR